MKHLPLLALLLGCTIVMIAFDRPLVRGDGIAYLAWLDSFVRDGDADLSNQRERFAAVNTYQIGINYETGHAYSIFPFGVAILQAPFYTLGDLFARAGWWDANPDYFRAMQGVEAPYSLWIMFGANLLTLGTVTLVYLIGRQLCDDWTAALAAFVTFIGTPLFYYSTLLPLNSHNAGAFTLAVFVALLWGGLQTRRSIFWWVLCGLAAALTVMARWQLATVIALGYGLLLWRRQWRGFALAAVVGAVALLPLPLVWNAMFGSPFVLPYDAASGAGTTGTGTFLGLPVHAPDVLFHTLLHSPVIALSLMGLLFLWHVDRAWAVFAGLAIASQVLVNGAALDWWAGDAYGMRRMSELYVLYGVLICAACGKSLSSDPAPVKSDAVGTRLVQAQPDTASDDNVQLNIAKKPNRSLWRHWGTRLALLALIPYSALYIVSFVNFTWTNQQGLFAAPPDVMIGYFLNQSYNWQIFTEVGAAHFGPAAWAMPGP